MIYLSVFFFRSSVKLMLYMLLLLISSHLNLPNNSVLKKNTWLVEKTTRVSNIAINSNRNWVVKKNFRYNY